MAVEYADKKEDTQNIPKPMTLALLLCIARRYRIQRPENQQLIRYVFEHADGVILNELSRRFSCYISALIHKEKGKTFKQLVLEKRINRAVILMKSTALSNEEISAMPGYSDQSNFYKTLHLVQLT